jgi:hypothetical protein
MVKKLYYDGRLLLGGEGKVRIKNKAFLIFQPEQVA